MNNVEIQKELDKIVKLARTNPLWIRESMTDEEKYERDENIHSLEKSSYEI